MMGCIDAKINNRAGERQTAPTKAIQTLIIYEYILQTDSTTLLTVLSLECGLPAATIPFIPLKHGACQCQTIESVGFITDRNVIRVR